MMTDAEKKLLQAQHRLEEAQARDRVKERKARTRRLIQEGAILEKVLPEVRTMEPTVLEDYLIQKLPQHDGICWEVSGKPGTYLFFLPKGALTHHPEGAVVCLRHRALSEGDFAFCGKRQTMPQHLRALLSSSARLGKYRRFNRRYFSNRLRKPATGSFAAEMDGPPARPFSLLRKRNRKKESR